METDMSNLDNNSTPAPAYQHSWPLTRGLFLVAKREVGSQVWGEIHICSEALADLIDKRVYVYVGDPNCEPSEDFLALKEDRDALLEDLVKMWRYTNWTPVPPFSDILKSALSSRGLSLERNAS
jgi:hypothetical protein